ncbi:IS66 family insertion sequence element accessory protein TnpB [Halorhodospira sp. 9621]|uniref:IS66 family insertion sequence element accessory protein TnpB n=1 Tax=Halorhodospira sp. 9621 TaxID=2899135 RepID=UPI001EE96CCC|nr:IS66 family insertion sequence element accessory protein TnpB [Halorhodospira sp. 9621]
MLTPPRRLWLCTRATDMRCSFDGLPALVRRHLGRDPLSGQGFIFINRRRTLMKLLYFDGDGYCVWSKRLERGQFGVGGAQAQALEALSWTQFAALLEGLDLTIRSRRKRWHKDPRPGVEAGIMDR